jgi:hypothetical protein
VPVKGILFALAISHEPFVLAPASISPGLNRQPNRGKRPDSRTGQTAYESRILRTIVKTIRIQIGERRHVTK